MKKKLDPLRWTSGARAFGLPALGLFLCASPAHAQDKGHTIGLQFAPYVLHWDSDPEHDNTPGLIGVEYMAPSQWLAGASILRNSFGQPTEYYYAGKRWDLDGLSPNLYAKVTAGALVGYTGRYEDKIPFNHDGVAFAVIPAIGYQVDRFNAQVALLGTAGVMFTIGVDLFKW
ncbi:hypothetical protein [Methyloversatilis thermotolerans]|uniref:hypothetical protein n=1 Tax=Methyloversatilis thermotolerans TaxID=1346290 RepID=UPI00036C62FC|nr:hypothetical protein [Methyloversatilis thermotolerans]